jgi:hypothetical protein
MHSVVRFTLWILTAVFALTSILAIGGVVYLWFYAEDGRQLPYLGWLLTLTVAEIAGLSILIAKKGLAYLPTVLSNKGPNDTEEFMSAFLGSGSSATIVSNRLSWLTSSQSLQTRLQQLARSGVSIEIIMTNEMMPSVRKPLEDAGVKFFVTGEDTPPESRFTLINANRAGSQKLAIARGVHPNHEITIFDTTSGPQIIAMAQDIITKCKRLSDAHKVE